MKTQGEESQRHEADSVERQLGRGEPADTQTDRTGGHRVREMDTPWDELSEDHPLFSGMEAGKMPGP